MIWSSLVCIFIAIFEGILIGQNDTDYIRLDTKALILQAYIASRCQVFFMPSLHLSCLPITLTFFYIVVTLLC